MSRCQTSQKSRNGGGPCCLSKEWTYKHTDFTFHFSLDLLCIFVFCQNWQNNEHDADLAKKYKHECLVCHEIYPLGSQRWSCPWYPVDGCHGRTVQSALLHRSNLDPLPTWDNKTARVLHPFTHCAVLSHRGLHWQPTSLHKYNF